MTNSRSRRAFGDSARIAECLRAARLHGMISPVASTCSKKNSRERHPMTSDST